MAAQGNGGRTAAARALKGRAAYQEALDRDARRLELFLRVILRGRVATDRMRPAPVLVPGHIACGLDAVGPLAQDDPAKQR
jgi:hypothetical protein